MSVVLATYSGADTNFTLQSPITGSILADGVSQKGIAQITVRMTETQSMLEVGMDGSVVPSAIPGDQGEIELQVFQTSTLNNQLLAWYNALKTARDAGDVTNWFGSTVLIQNTVDGSQHMALGVGPQRVPEKSYQKQAQRVTWTLVACNITTTNMSPV